MSVTTIILLNIGIAAILVAIIATLMASPRHLRRHFANGYTHRQWHAFHRQHGEPAPRRPGGGPRDRGASYPDSAASTLRSSPTHAGRNG